MGILSKLTGGIAATALIASAASPAAARDWNWGKRGHYHDRGPSAGEVIGAVAVVGLLAAIVSSASKKKEAEQRRAEDAPRDGDRYAERYDDRGGYDDEARYDGRGGDAPRYDETRADRSQDAAVDACAVAARDEASRNGDYAEIRGVTGVSPLGSGWDISGRVEQRSSFRATDGWQRNFRCAWQNGRVSAVSLN